jgi:hypothetical protein
MEREAPPVKINYTYSVLHLPLVSLLALKLFNPACLQPLVVVKDSWNWIHFLCLFL